MSNQQFLKPAAGRLVRHPGDDKRPLAQDGVLVEITSYWRRKLNAGDVVQVEKPIAEPAPALEKTSRAVSKGGNE